MCIVSSFCVILLICGLTPNLNVMNDIIIRFVSQPDVTKLAKLRFALRSRDSSNVETEAAFLKRCESWMAEVLNRTTWRCWVAEQEGDLLGALWLQLIEKIPNPTAESECFGYITNFFVAESARGKGLGSRILDEALAWCREQNVHAVILWPTEKSRSLYQRHGFTLPDDLLELELSDSDGITGSVPR